MQAKYEKGRVSFDLYDLIETMLHDADAETRRQMLTTIACDSQVIEFVAQQIIDKWTDDGSHGAIGGAQAQEYAGLGKAWRDVAKASGDVAKREIERLEDALRRSNELYHQYVAEVESRSRRNYGI